VFDGPLVIRRMGTDRLRAAALAAVAAVALVVVTLDATGVIEVSREAGGSPFGDPAGAVEVSQVGWTIAGTMLSLIALAVGLVRGCQFASVKGNVLLFRNGVRTQLVQGPVRLEARKLGRRYVVVVIDEAAGQQVLRATTRPTEGAIDELISRLSH
jgi:hypothetical protein